MFEGLSVEKLEVSLMFALCLSASLAADNWQLELGKSFATQAPEGSGHPGRTRDRRADGERNLCVSRRVPFRCRMQVRGPHVKKDLCGSRSTTGPERRTWHTFCMATISASANNILSEKLRQNLRLLEALNKQLILDGKAKVTEFAFASAVSDEGGCAQELAGMWNWNGLQLLKGKEGYMKWQLTVFKVVDEKDTVRRQPSLRLLTTW